MRVIKDRQARCAIEVSVSPKQRALIRLDSLGAVELMLHPEEWLGTPLPGEPRPPSFTFDEYWKPLLANGQPYSVHEAARRFLRGVNSYPKIVPTFGYGAVEALVDCLPDGAVSLFTIEGGFIGRFTAPDDAVLIARARNEVPIVFETAADLAELPAKDLRIVQTHLDSNRQWPVKATAKLYKELIDMTKKVKKTAPKKVQKVEASRKRADGPVAQARAIFEKMRNETDSSKIIAACVAIKINKGTAGVQLGRWRKENGIKVQRGGARVKAVAKKEAPKAAAKGKKEPTKKKVEAKSVIKPAAKKPTARKSPVKVKPAVAPVAAGSVVDSQQPGTEAGQQDPAAAAS